MSGQPLGAEGWDAWWAGRKPPGARQRSLGQGMPWSQCDRTGGAGLPLSRGHLGCPVGTDEPGFPKPWLSWGVG